MTKNTPERLHKSGCDPATCQVEAVLSIDSRGQIVIPKEVRKRAHIHDDDKLALVSWMTRDEIFCLALIRTDDLFSGASGMMQSMLADKD
jgi:AbrB family looped-hinge helix DNA binding protein